MELNGYPITAQAPAENRRLLHGLHDSRFPVQVRHGSAQPQRIMRALARAGIGATEGGPVSYCLPYGRTPLPVSVRNWREGCDLLLAGSAQDPHVETFGGCLLGQLCPPGLLVAVSLLEALFFRQAGFSCVSLSYAQQTDERQDEQAVRALRRLAGQLLPGTRWHVVLYTYIGLFPRTPEGATRLLVDSARLAVRSGAARLIVKTTAEAHRIPTIAENVRALEVADAAARSERGPAGAVEPSDDTGLGAEAKPAENEVYLEARSIVEGVLNLDGDVGRALVVAFSRGYLDVPYCLHPDNAGQARSTIDSSGRLVWSDPGRIPVGHRRRGDAAPLTARGLLRALSYVQDRFDRPCHDQTPNVAVTAAGPTQKG